MSWRFWVFCVGVYLLHEPSKESRVSSGCSISWVSPSREDGASACPGDTGSSVFRVFLLHEPSRESRASSGTS